MPELFCTKHTCSKLFCTHSHASSECFCFLHWKCYSILFSPGSSECTSIENFLQSLPLYTICDVNNCQVLFKLIQLYCRWSLYLVHQKCNIPHQIIYWNICILSKLYLMTCAQAKKTFHMAQIVFNPITS